MRQSTWNVKPAAFSQKCFTFPLRIVAQAQRKSACGDRVRPKPVADRRPGAMAMVCEAGTTKFAICGSLLSTYVYQHRSRTEACTTAQDNNWVTIACSTCLDRE